MCLLQCYNVVSICNLTLNVFEDEKWKPVTFSITFDRGTYYNIEDATNRVEHIENSVKYEKEIHDYVTERYVMEKSTISDIIITNTIVREIKEPEDIDSVKRL